MPPPSKPVLAVKVQPVVYGMLRSTVTATGRVISSQQVVVSSEVRGRILVGDIPFKEGQTFKKGAVLLRVFNDDFVFGLKAKKSAFLQKLAGILPDMKVDFPDRYETWMHFFNDIDIDGRLPEIPEPVTEKEKVFIAARSILNDYYTIKSDEVTLDKYVISAPFGGSFTEVLLETGAIANTGATLARIIRTDHVELEVPVDASDARFISIGDPVTVATASGGITAAGTVVRKADFVNASTQSLNVFVKIKPGRDNPVYPGQYLSAEFPGKDLSGVMEIPRSAVFNSNEVFIVVDGKLYQRTVTIHKVNRETLLFSGLDEGFDLVVEPLVNAVEQSPVQVIR